MHPSTFEYLKPTEEQIKRLAEVRKAFAVLGEILDYHLPDGDDKDWVVRQLRTAAMWANVAVTRDASAAPRGDRLVASGDGFVAS